MNRALILKNTRFAIIRAIMDILFEKESIGLKNREKRLIDRHVALGGSKDGFRYLGRIYSNLEGSIKKLGSYDQPKDVLIPELSALMTDRKILEEDKKSVQQAMAMVLRDCTNVQDMRDALPNGLTELIGIMRNLDRTRPEAYTLMDNPVHYHQYMNMKPKIEFYLGSRLLY